MNFISRNYTPNAMIAELISSKNKEIDWLKEEIKFLRGENEKLLLIVNERTSSLYNCDFKHRGIQTLFIPRSLDTIFLVCCIMT